MHVDARAPDPFSTPQSASSIGDVLGREDADSPLMFFPTAPIKLGVMGLCTMGLYSVYWCYKNFRAQKSGPVGAFFRMIFIAYSSFGFFGAVHAAAKEHQIEPRFNPTVMGVLLFVTVIASRLSSEGSFWMGTTIAQPLLFIPIARCIEQLRVRIDPGVDANQHFTAGNYVAIAFGLLLWALAIWATFVEFTAPGL